MQHFFYIYYTSGGVPYPECNMKLWKTFLGVKEFYAFIKLSFYVTLNSEFLKVDNNFHCLVRSPLTMLI
jgi:hypothetical protein